MFCKENSKTLLLFISISIQSHNSDNTVSTDSIISKQTLQQVEATTHKHKIGYCNTTLKFFVFGGQLTKSIYTSCY